MTTKIITVANFKGGVGKSSTCVSLGHGLAMAGRAVLLCDLDPQGQLAILLGQRQESGVFDLLVSQVKPDQLIRSTGREGLKLLPGDARTATAQYVTSAERKPITFLAERLKPVLKAYDFVIIDTSPSIGDLQAMALHAADLLIIPSAVDFLAADGTVKLVNTVKSIKDQYGWPGKLLILATFFDEMTKESKTVLADLQAKFGDGVFKTVIHRATILREAAAYGATVFEVDPKSRAAEEYDQLVQHVLKL